MEAQLNWLIKAITIATNVVAEEMKKQATKVFSEVNTRLDSLFDVLLKKSLEAVTIVTSKYFPLDPCVNHFPNPQISLC